MRSEKVGDACKSQRLGMDLVQFSVKKCNKERRNDHETDRWGENETNSKDETAGKNEIGITSNPGGWIDQTKLINKNSWDQKY